jgi:DNA-binding transcriptional LysR family regulator
MTTNTAISTSNTAAGEYLLERLRILLNRLQNAADILQKWPEATADSAKIHADTATE